MDEFTSNQINAYMKGHEQDIQKLENNGITVKPTTDIVKMKINFFFVGFFLFLGLLAIGGALYYSGHLGFFKSSLICGSVNLTCEKHTCTNTCPSIPSCPSCDCKPIFNFTEVNYYYNSS